ncbi:hypothetical protein [Mycobacterium sp. Marseille-P9652]|uniref:hypothetical protein n=1 Tax=Mycobacterium sp. Marseille-P9652 TaxID=2654950 RepID=UPI0012E93A5B|nr:hypothetical protein [Mycobacterium sp. Marseille-P9652]
MTTPPTPPAPPVSAAQQFVDQVSQLWVDAAEKSDSPEGLGIDGRIALVHRLCDLSVKGWVALVQFAIRYPLIPAAPSVSAKPLPSEPITVPAAAPYVRQLAAKGPFERVGMANVKIPVSAIGFDPPFLPAGITQFQIVLKDDNYIGHNYQGTVLVSTQTGAPEEISVYVGL